MPTDSRLLEIILKARDEATDIVKGFGKTMSNVGEMIDQSFNNAAIVSGVAIGALSAEAFRSVAAFEESARGVMQLETVLKSTNGVAGITKERALQIASGLEEMTSYSDDAVLSAENLMLTFTAINKDVFPQAIETALDMSTALGQDTKSSVIQLGKALQDPILGVSALARVGVNFNEQQKETIKSLVENGRTMEAQRLILKELNTEFGGSAEAATATFSGRLEQLKNQFGNIEEVIGQVIVNALAPFVEKAFVVVGGIQGMIQGSITLEQFTHRLGTEFGVLGTIVGSTITFFSQHREALVALTGAFVGILIPGILKTVVTIGGFLGLASPMTLLFMLIAAGVTLVVTHFDQIRAAFESTLQNATAFISNLGKTVLDGLTYFKNNFFESIGFLIGFVAGRLLYLLTQLAITVVDTIKNTDWNAAWMGFLSAAISVFANVFIAALNLYKSLGDINWGEVIAGIGKSIANAIIGLVEGGIRGVASGIPGVGDVFKSIKLPRFEDGGYVPSTGLAILHAGEFVLPREVVSGRSAVGMMSASYNQPITINATVNNDTDLNLIGYRLSWMLRNSR